MAEDLGFAARCLLRAARVGTLATQDRGQPFASLVTPTATPGGDVLLVLSALSAHTRHLTAEPRCALLVCGAAEAANPQTAPRLTVIGHAAVDPDPASRRAWLARHPYAVEYAAFTDFSVWCLKIHSGHFVGGFARAHALDAGALHPVPAFVEAIQAAAPDILAHFNGDHAESLGWIARQHCPDKPGAWRMGAVDVDGMDLAAGDAVVRVPFDRPVTSGAELRSALVRLIERAKKEH